MNSSASPAPVPGLGDTVADALATLLRRPARAALHRRLTEGLGEAVDEVTYPVLSALARTGARSAADLATEIGLDRSGVSRRATRLQAAGLLHRETDPRDQRATLLALTPAGEQTVAEMRRRLAAAIEEALAPWPAGEAEAFARGLQRFTEHGPFNIP
ncbi:MarR family winged helix-turn-helix transcriptional regulator [Kitasatospora aureofaciens]|uniref:MarR family winged helix-turn-helix transcriptional regulator n=1 Tax=Kitasatospora aureofaciens TaxID=1894 RepID=UPI001C47586F|nr:MarR family transcriptional regulator [Kitasatospora aureofaciens]MBV6699163.1 MarR family transcriptional regulator [Kitasatospora aureofaciens]